MQDEAGKISLLKTYFDTRRGSGHTLAMVNGIANMENVTVIVHNHRYGKDIQRICGRRVNFISWDEIDKLRGSSNALVIDNSGMSLILGDALEMRRKLMVENLLLKEYIKDIKAKLNIHKSGYRTDINISLSEVDEQEKRPYEQYD